ncbi:transcriptional regulator, ArsR family [Rhizobiales bacterium GAS191]|nr:transcriptional regulator, ArsR family [Rhizobiales bacterium GAS113]SEE12101.1 transcriptional regulator, ArsR family [Rhizobiales bacterium GAS188]SEE44705.1 transcriptional regulator, ArsR family [Rhizobiales bacterium GAS191]
MAKPLHHPGIDQIDLSSLLDALSDPVRRRIVRRLNEEKEMHCGSFGDEGAKSNLTYHFAKLREAGVTRTRIEGAYRHISLRLAELETRFPGLLTSVLAASERE